MGRIDRSQGQDRTLERRHIRAMLRNIAEYEQIKKKQHIEYRQAEDFYKAKGICRQNFLKYYRRYINSNREEGSLLPHRTGRKFKDCITYKPEVIEKVKAIREKGYNKFDMAEILSREKVIEISPSTVYRLMKKLGINTLNPRIKEEKRKIMKTVAGELGHIDIHYVAKGTVKSVNHKLYILGVIDDYSRVCWLEVIDSIKAIDVMFSTQEILWHLKGRYGVQFKEMISDNGSEFASRNNPNHPFEKMLRFYDIKHRYTKPCRPQTNGKIERFWKTLENELLDGEEFDTLQELREYLLGYVVYYNENRQHQGINNKIPAHLASKDVVNAVGAVDMCIN